jgi:hypothetical protein
MKRVRVHDDHIAFISDMVEEVNHGIHNMSEKLSSSQDNKSQYFKTGVHAN